MEVNELIRELRNHGLHNGTTIGHHSGLYEVAADALEIQQKRIAELEEQLRWIPVTERMPDRNLPVLVRCTNTTISGGYVTHIGSCDSEKFWFLKTQPGTASFPVREWQVTHWMPLPEPPKGE